MNLGDVKTRVKRQFGDESGVQVTDGDIVRWTNDGMRDIVNQNEGILETIGTADIVAGTGEYAVPVTAFNLRSISFKAPQALSYFKLRYLSFQEFEQMLDGWDGAMFANTVPMYWTRFANLVKLFPVPGTSATGALKLYFQRYPVDVVNDGDLLDLPIQYHNAVVKYCLSQAYELDEDWDSAGNSMQAMTADLAANREREQWKSQDFYPTITVLPEDRDDFFWG